MMKKFVERAVGLFEVVHGQQVNMQCIMGWTTRTALSFLEYALLLFCLLESLNSGRMETVDMDI